MNPPSSVPSYTRYASPGRVTPISVPGPRGASRHERTSACATPTRVVAANAVRAANCTRMMDSSCREKFTLVQRRQCVVTSQRCLLCGANCMLVHGLCPARRLHPTCDMDEDLTERTSYMDSYACENCFRRCIWVRERGATGE